ncbi:hypothetical protein [Natrarchaeobaculum sulfurireducens]|uniref:Uncharacterized protein n=1 Tax=Natrarchaeobaculum sulfurireducens TaxID=2044521 RepID=A0A346PI78_9EURY|nr:hypothetical protein [Natrarchaeobaculum sulfurireducens]AXR79223.1 hypothetical protein AArc1_2914 [Natrarchaeobaculum sulfurireducens]AXR80732.1 hypothetical protein AArcMg_0710 [Natrarchaeobaculum sulfurireducens]
MLSRIRDGAPVVLIPAAWTTVGATQVDLVSEQSVFVALLVMAAFIAFFTVTGWRLMGDGALRAWRAVLVVGFGLTLCGIAGFLVSSAATALLGVSLVGWMILPAVGLAYTGRELPTAAVTYLGGAACCLVGAIVFSLAIGVFETNVGALSGIALVAVGQTAGIVDASRR